MKLTYFLIWLTTVDIAVLLIFAIRALAKGGFRGAALEDERYWHHLLHPGQPEMNANSARQASCGLAVTSTFVVNHIQVH